MKIYISKLSLIIVILLSLIILFFSLWSIVYEDQWLLPLIISNGILLILTFIIVFFSLKKFPKGAKNVIKEFEKTLEGKLHHFKCPICKGIFAIKKSKYNNKKSFILTCPDCGNVGTITSSPKLIVEKIPKQKSINKNFKCYNCGEFVSIWSEGTEIFKKMEIKSCPYCGIKHSLDNI